MCEWMKARNAGMYIKIIVWCINIILLYLLCNYKIYISVKVKCNPPPIQLPWGSNKVPYITVLMFYSPKWKKGIHIFKLQ